MSQFVSEQAAALRGIGIEAPEAEHDVVSNCVGLCVDRPSRCLCVLVRMHTHVAEVVAKAGFEEGPKGLWKRPAPRSTGIDVRVQMDRDFRSVTRNLFGLKCFVFLKWLPTQFLFTLTTYSLNAGSIDLAGNDKYFTALRQAS
jgi:hypothetical protein